MEARQMQLLVSEKEAHLQANNQAILSTAVPLSGTRTLEPVLQRSSSRDPRINFFPSVCVGKADMSLRSLGNAPPPRIFLLSIWTCVT